MAQTLSINAGQCSQAGIKESNEDSCGIRVPKHSLLRTKGIAAIIADGVSSSAAGREASETCVHSFLNDYYSTPESWSTKQSGQKILSALNRWLYGKGIRQYDSSMGFVTTLSALILKSTTAYVFHIGDTRIYRLRDGVFECLTKDHRIISSGGKTFLSHAIGVDLNLDVDYFEISLELNDIYLLATDGVHEFLDDKSLSALIQTDDKTPEEITQSIVTKALENGSNDNLTCQLIKVDSLPFHDNEEAFYRQLTELPFPPPLEANQILDGYRIIRELHASKRTQVYLAINTITDKKVILKTPSINYSDDARYIDRFLQEEWVGRRINSQYVLKVLEHTTKRNFIYYVMEYIEGQTLRQWMNDNSNPSLSKIREIVEQISRGLNAFHKLEMVHQDLKPENIIIDTEGTVKIIDFGSTKIAGIEEISTPLGSNNDVLGTMNYTAPEIFEAAPGSIQSDLFSLGIITYEMLTGKLPYGEEISSQKLKRAEYKSAIQHNSSIPNWVDRAIQKAIHKNTYSRYSEISEFIFDLNNPNPDFLKETFKPLLEKNPIAFWQSLSAILLLLNLILVFLIFNQ